MNLEVLIITEHYNTETREISEAITVEKSKL